MKTSILAIFLFCAAGAFAQNGTVLQNVPQPYQPPDDRSARAVEHSMGQETSLLSGLSITYAKGEVPLSDLASPMYQTPLGDIARAYRKEHADVPKAVKTLEN